jgi:hypothetical protein
MIRRTDSTRTLRGIRARGVVLAAALGLALAMPATVAAATVSNTYWISGAEYSASATVGSFAGTATGSSGDVATWEAVVEHTVLHKTATITGGHATVLTSNLVYIQGDFSGGSVTRIYQAPGCSIQRYDVTGSLVNVHRSDSATIGVGTFQATLTHYRTRIFGECISYFATVSGSIGLTF